MVMKPKINLILCRNDPEFKKEDLLQLEYIDQKESLLARFRL
jgi:hypothetical protein